MSGDVLNMAREDIIEITSEGGFETDVTVITKDKVTSVVVPAIAMKHHMAFDTEGQKLNSEQAHVSISESKLVDAGYPVRVDGDVSMIGAIVKYKDSTDVEGKYKVNENYPDETLGLIVLILSRYA